MNDGLQFNLRGKELIGLYLLLSEQEESLDPLLQRLRERLEDRLYEGLSIEEMERIETMYTDQKP
jgi:hypothetical protein